MELYNLNYLGLVAGKKITDINSITSASLIKTNLTERTIYLLPHAKQNNYTSLVEIRVHKIIHPIIT